MLDADKCVDLLSLLRVLKQINQEQAWALAYELATLMRRHRERCKPIENLSQIYLHVDGYVHEKTTRTSSNSGDKNNANNDDDDQDEHNNSSTSKSDNVNNNNHRASEQELVASLGLALFRALDYGIPDDEERKLALSMEYLIYQSQTQLTLDECVDMCVKRLPASLTSTSISSSSSSSSPTTPESTDLTEEEEEEEEEEKEDHKEEETEEADKSSLQIATTKHPKRHTSAAGAHYREVCRRLVSDTVELSSFLERIYRASLFLSEITGQPLDALGCRLAAAAAADEVDASRHVIKRHQHHHHNVIKDLKFGLQDHSDLAAELGEPLASLHALQFNEWARLWMQVIRELRQRGKFKQALAIN